MTNRTTGRQVHLKHMLNEAMTEGRDELRGQAADAQPPETPPEPPAPSATAQTPADVDDQAPRSSGQAPTGTPTRRFDSLARLDVRITDDQLQQLTALELAMRSHKRKAGERITKNTLIRVAVAGLLAHADQIDGSTEDELRDAYLATWP